MSNDGWGNIPNGGWTDAPVSWGETKSTNNKQRFELEWDDKTWNVEAIVVGELAVICGQEPYSIIHIHTKGRFDNAIPHGEWTVEELIGWCEKVNNLFGYWEDLKLVNSADDWSNDKQVIARGYALAHCRNVKVK